MCVQSQISAQEMFWLAGLQRKDFMVNLWQVAIDDSGDEKKSEFVLAGSLFGAQSDWDEFNEAWKSCLHNDPKIEHFHQKELTDLSGEFIQFRDKGKWPKPLGSEAANRKRDALAEVIAQSSLRAHGLALSVPVYLEVRDCMPNAKMFLDPDPWVYLLQEVAFDTARRIRELDPKASIAFLSDGKNKKVAERYTDFYFGFKKKNPQIAKYMTGITHGEDEKYYALQAADLIASEAKKCCDHIFETKEKVRDIHIPLFKRFVEILTIPKERIEGIIARQAINRS
jgi:hypothetical protein